MADTRRTWAALDALFADNTTGDITAQALRDGFQSLEPHVAAAAPTVTDDSSAGFDKGHAWINTSTTPDTFYKCLDAAVGAAVWAQVYPVALHTHVLADITDAGSAAAAATTDFATAAQGSTADAALPATDARVPPTPVGQADGRMLAVATDALVYVDAPNLSVFATATGFTDMVALTQAAYDLLTPDANTLYFIT